jgi:hypothetical protein
MAKTEGPSVCRVFSIFRKVLKYTSMHTLTDTHTHTHTQRERERERERESLAAVQDLISLEDKIQSDAMRWGGGASGAEGDRRLLCSSGACSS